MVDSILLTVCMASCQLGSSMKPFTACHVGDSVAVTPPSLLSACLCACLAGDIESMPFVEALRQFQFKVGESHARLRCCRPPYARSVCAPLHCLYARCLAVPSIFQGLFGPRQECTCLASRRSHSVVFRMNSALVFPIACPNPPHVQSSSLPILVSNLPPSQS